MAQGASDPASLDLLAHRIAGTPPGPLVPWTCHGLRALATAACGNAPRPAPWPTLAGRDGAAAVTLPPAQAAYDFEMAYDSADGYVVLLGVVSGTTPATGTDMWSFRGGIWQDLLPSPLPENCPGSTLTYDDRDGYLVYLAAPSTPWVPCASGNETWTYHAGLWTHLFPAVSPSGRYGAAVTNDTADGYLLLFGGMSAGCLPNNSQCNDTWKFSGGTWTQLHPTVSPSVRQESGITYDAADRYVLLFGGVGPSYQPGLNDTWAFSAGSWTQLHPAVSPPWPEPDALSYDAADREAVFTSAWNSSGPLQEVVWTYRGGNWAESLSAAPPQRLGAQTAFDYADGYLLFFGGYGYAPDQSTWTFLAGVWTNITMVIPPLGVASVSVAPANVTVNQFAVLSVTAFGGSPPYTYTYSGLPNGCTSTNNSTLICYPVEAGRFAVVVTVTDSVGQAVLATAFLTVVPLAIRIEGFSADPNPAFVNQSVTFSMSVLGGAPPFTFAYSGLPPGCVSGNVSSLTCRPTWPGTYVVTVEVADSFGLNGTSVMALHVTVAGGVPPPLDAQAALDWFVVVLLLVGVGAIAALGVAVVLLLNPRTGRPPPF